MASAPGTLFVSDLHLDAARPQATRDFCDLLAARRGLNDALYILGDLVEYWLGDDQAAGALQPAFDAIGEAAAGCPAFFMHGNRDFLIGNRFADAYGLTLLSDPSVVELYGVATLLLHGDTLCTDDHDYQAFRRTVRDPAWQADFLARPLSEREAIARQVRTSSQAAMAQKSMAIMDVNAGAVTTAFVSHGVRRMIHGHTHRPAIHTVNAGGHRCQRLVLGDWYAGASYAVVDAAGWRLVPDA